MVEQNDFVLSHNVFRPFMLSTCSSQTYHLFSVDFFCYRLTGFHQLMMDHSFLVPPNAQHRRVSKNILLCLGSQCLSWVNAGVVALRVIPGHLFCIFCYQFSKLLDLSHGLKMIGNCWWNNSCKKWVNLSCDRLTRFHQLMMNLSFLGPPDAQHRRVSKNILLWLGSGCLTWVNPRVVALLVIPGNLLCIFSYQFSKLLDISHGMKMIGNCWWNHSCHLLTESAEPP